MNTAPLYQHHTQCVHVCVYCTGVSFQLHAVSQRAQGHFARPSGLGAGLGSRLGTGMGSRLGAGLASRLGAGLGSRLGTGLARCWAG